MNERARRWQRFWSKVHMTSSCWIWTGACDPEGYGNFWWGDGVKVIKAHRAALRLTCREFDDTLVVLHTCDNPSCVNPRHLTPGTQVENMRDRYRKGRCPRDSRGRCLPLSREGASSAPPDVKAGAAHEGVHHHE